MNESRKHAGTLELRGGRLCLDFANTVSWHATNHSKEWLLSYADILAWGQHASILTDHQKERLLQEARSRPASAEATVVWAITLREAIYQIFSLSPQGRLPQAENLATLQKAYAEAMVHASLVPRADSFTFNWQSNEDALDVPLWSVAHSAMELLTSKDLQRVKECPGDGCGWLFVDMSRNQSRRWCNGQDCGNRIRVRHHYQHRKTVNEH